MMKRENEPFITSMADSRSEHSAALMNGTPHLDVIIDHADFAVLTKASSPHALRSLWLYAFHANIVYL